MKTSKRRSGCPVNACLEMFGDRWSLLIVRDLMMRGFSTFKQLQEGGEGIATNILTDRLQRLEAAGILSKEEATDRRRWTYRLTPKGIDLAPVLVEMILWAARYEDTQAPPRILRRMTDRDRFIADLRKRLAKPTP